VARLQMGVFASGRGSNFLSILNAIDERRLDADIRILISNNPEAGALNSARGRNIPAGVINRADFPDRETFVREMFSVLRNHGADFIALAGYMKKIPDEVIHAFAGRIINIHPALLPAFGGKGMYGRFVHEAVVRAGCKVSGATVHLVDDQYDHGPIVAQRAIPIPDTDTPEDVAARVLRVEHQIYPETLQLFAEDKVRVRNGRTYIR